MSSATHIDQQILSDAADWFALMRSGQAGDSDTLRWQQWLRQHPDHLRGWQMVERIEQQFSTASAATHPAHAEATLKQARHNRIQRRSVITGLALAMGTGGLGWVSWRQTPLPHLVTSWNAQYRTGTGEIRALELADGSRLWLNTNSAIDTLLSGPQRQIHVIQGEVLIETGKADPRPLVVFTPQGQLQPLGTRFTVRRETDTTFLAVYDGAVEITNQAQQKSVLHPQQQTRFSADALQPALPADPAREAWHKGILVADDIRLDALVDELSRYQHGYINISPAVADLRVFGGFPLTDPQQALDMLASALPIRVTRPLPGWTNIDPSSP
ncbi:FecR domain-containing protein [Alcanivorax sp.]|jgi:transmembrane sensor|uniref:FecR domain-containing protein n=1 Tax=Alcanivorax sp. TaxID=1872427 RepID=UPI0032D9A677